MPGDDSSADKAKAREKADREAAELWAQILRQELRHRKTSRDAFEYHERIIGTKVRQLRMERNWSQADLAQKLDELGWPIHQTNISKLEAGRRPIRVAEADALALAFGLPMLALWYLPVTGEPWSIADMRKRMQKIDESIATTEKTLHSMISMYADEQFERTAVAKAINEAAKAAENGELEDLNLDAETTQALAEGLDPDDHRRFIRSLPPDHPAALRYKPLDEIEQGEPQRLASEAYRMYQAGASEAEMSEFLAKSIPPGARDRMAAAAQIIAEAFGASPYPAPPAENPAERNSVDRPT